MAETKKKNPWELLKYKPFKDGKEYKDDIVVLFNGRKYTVKRGVDNMIPRCVLTVIMQNEQQRINSNEFKQAQQEAFAASSKNI